MCVLLSCWGVDSLIGLSPISFPASVALLIVLFLGLGLSEITLGDRKTKKIVQIIDIPVSSPTPIHASFVMVSWWDRLGLPSGTSMFSSCLLLVSVRFPLLSTGYDIRKHQTHSDLVTLPLSPPVSGLEVGKIIAVFRKGARFQGLSICSLVL